MQIQLEESTTGEWRRRRTNLVVLGISILHRLDLGRQSVEERDVLLHHDEIEVELEVPGKYERRGTISIESG